MSRENRKRKEDRTKGIKTLLDRKNFQAAAKLIAMEKLPDNESPVFPFREYLNVIPESEICTAIKITPRAIRRFRRKKGDAG